MALTLDTTTSTPPIFNIPAYAIHPLALTVALMRDEELEALRESMRAQGLLHPLVLFEGQVLDGRHRYQICRELGIVPAVTEYMGDDPQGYVRDTNVVRRHLNPGQIAFTALAELAEAEKTTGERQRAGKRSATGDDHLGEQVPQGQWAREFVAQRYGVNMRYLSLAKRIAATDTALAAQVRDGVTTITEATRLLDEREGKLPPEMVTAAAIGDFGIATITVNADLGAAPTPPWSSDGNTAPLAEATNGRGETGSTDPQASASQEGAVEHAITLMGPSMAVCTEEQGVPAETVLDQCPSPTEDFATIRSLMSRLDPQELHVLLLEATPDSDLIEMVLGLLPRLDDTGRLRIRAAIPPVTPARPDLRRQSERVPYGYNLIENRDEQLAIAFVQALYAHAHKTCRLEHDTSVYKVVRLAIDRLIPRTTRGGTWTLGLIFNLRKSALPVLRDDEQARVDGWVRAAFAGTDAADLESMAADFD